METENWPQVKEILELAIERPPGEREHFIEEKCSGDAALRNKIDSLISSYERVGDFMEDGPMGSVADMFTSDDELQPGERLGRYEVVRVLGEGGMGKVYLADDLDLHRQVAIKVLRNDLWWYKQARQRLSREARAAAGLDHPNICSIYEIEDSDERSFIVMQYIEGETLAEAMARGLGMRESLRIALQIADALEEAHSHHIIHRDIKPANILINEKRQAKVLDFGLAKSIKPESEENEMDLSSSGAVMGTVPYMSPEQLRGKTVDGRSDIFSFGALLYEMICGRQAFRRDSNAETISSILNDEPDLSVIPARFRPVIERALRKKVGERYQSISEVARDLRSLEIETVDEKIVPEHGFSNWFGAKTVISTAFRRYFSDKTGRQGSTGRPLYSWQDSDSDARTVRLTEPLSAAPATERHPITLRTRPVLLLGISIFVLALIPVFLYWFIRPHSDPHAFDDLHAVRLVEWKAAGSNIYLGYSSSHNGKMIAYSTKQEGPNESIYVKPIPNGDEVRVTKDQWTSYAPIWSPDDQQLAFVSLRNGTYGIYTSPFLGGAASLVKVIDDKTLLLRHWANDGSAIYYEVNSNLYKLDLVTKQTDPITSFEPRESPRRDFAFSPNEDRVVYCDMVNGQTDLWIAPVKGGKTIHLTDDPEVEGHPSWSPDGERIIYSVVRDGYNQISVVYLDGRSPEQITRGEGEHLLVDVSADGKNIFYTTWEDRSDVWRVSLETGQEFQVAAGREAEFWPDVSPDGKLILYQINSAFKPIPFINDSKIAIRVMGVAETPKLFSGYDPRWLPDSRHIAFLRSVKEGKLNALWIADTVTGSAEPVINEGIDSPGESALPYNRMRVKEFTWSPDSSEISYISRISGASNAYKKIIGAPESISLSANSDQSVTYYSPLFSPNGKSIAYVSVQKQPGEGSKSKFHVWVDEEGNSREIYSATDGLRLLGWDGNENLILETVNGLLTAYPADVRMFQLSIKGSSHVTAELKNVYMLSATLSTDGRTVAFTARQNDRDDIFTIPITGGAVKKISSNSDPRIFYGSLTWSPDGKSIYFDKQERINTISMFENFK
jgi:serine/threonine protein kinase